MVRSSRAFQEDRLSPTREPQLRFGVLSVQFDSEAIGARSGHLQVAFTKRTVRSDGLERVAVFVLRPGVGVGKGKRGEGRSGGIKERRCERTFGGRRK